MKRSPMPPRRTPLARKRQTAAVPPDVRRAVRARSRGLCEIDHPGCTGRAVHLHHRRLRSQGGRHTVGNLLDVCPSGHRWIHANPAESYERGWMLRGDVA